MSRLEFPIDLYDHMEIDLIEGNLCIKWDYRLQWEPLEEDALEDLIQEHQEVLKQLKKLIELMGDENAPIIK